MVALAQSSDGRLWIGATTGLYTFDGVRFEEFDPAGGQRMPARGVNALLALPDGSLWIGFLYGGVSVLAGDRLVHHAEPEGLPASTVMAFALDLAGDGWAATTTGLLRRTGGRWRRVGAESGFPGGLTSELLVDRRGALWASEATGVYVLPRGAQRFVRRGPPLDVAESGGGDVEEAPDGSVWGASRSHGLIRLSDPSGGPPQADSDVRRGRDVGTWGMLIDREASAWLFGDWDRLVRIPLLSALGAPTAAHPTARQTRSLSRTTGLWQARGATFVPIPLPVEAARKEVNAIARDRDGTLWLSIPGRAPGGVFRRRGGAWRRFATPPEMLEAFATTIVADSAGRTWLGFRQDRLALVAGDAVRVFSAAAGLRVGNVTAIHVRGDRVWIGGESGVVLLADARRGRRFEPLLTAGGTLRGITGIVETRDGDLWLNGAGGVTRIPAVELRRAGRDPRYRVRNERLDFRDGVDGVAPQVRPFPSAIESSDGRLWFTTVNGVTWVHPRSMRRNRLPAPMRITTVKAGRQRHATAGRVALPARTTELQIRYTALSLAVPERVRFRYRLIGSDTGWQDAGTRREAIYTNLGPGAYRFQVIAANDAGVWNQSGAALEVVIPPTFLQTKAFLALCTAVAAGTLWGLVLWRQRRVTAVMHARFDDTLAERMRIARELHDTLLSGVAGLAMRLDAVATRARSSAGVDVTALDELRREARDTLLEARQAVVGMRASSDALVPLHAQLADAARRILASTDLDARVSTTGTPRRYAQTVEEQVLRIATEAMANAREHAQCRTIAVTCAYGRRELCVGVRDDGRGLNAARAAANGHFGLAGMRERAAAIGARLTIESALGRGTDVLLVIVHGPG